METTTATKTNFFKWLITIVAIFFILIVISAGAWLLFDHKYQSLVYPGVYLGNLEMAGKTKAEAKAAIDKQLQKINQDGFKIIYRDQTTVLPRLVSSLESDLTYELYDFDADATVARIYGYGRQGNYFQDFKSKFRAIVLEQRFRAAYEINEPGVKKFLLENFSHYETPALDAKLTYAPITHGSSVTFAVEEEKYGQIINYDEALARFKASLSTLNNSPLELTAKIDYPELLKKNILNVNAKAASIYEQAPLTLTHEALTWTIEKTNLIDWLILKPSPESETDIIVGLDADKVKAYFEERVNPKIDQEARDGKFKIEEGRVEEFQASQDGVRVDTEATLALLETQLIDNAAEKVSIVTQVVKSSASIEEINDFGIKEKLGEGHSSFAGSPKNRRHNIAIGAAALNGILIAPDEEFSLMGTLGKIDGAAGYLPELVIKNNKTIPEYGGGLCQIGTTLFRATVGTGLPVTQRRNHSYRVSYYEPAGTDATIYDPWPDYRFANDTGNYLLLQTKIEGDDIYFEFWGTPDGRVATHTYPVITNIVRPGPTKIIETLDLEPGVKKCTESAHNGADAYFDYRVEYSNANPPAKPDEEGGLVVETRFKSHYVPWREVCLLGVERLSSDKDKVAPPVTASSTPAQE